MRGHWGALGAADRDDEHEHGEHEHHHHPGARNDDSTFGPGDGPAAATGDGPAATADWSCQVGSIP